MSDVPAVQLFLTFLANNGMSDNNFVISLSAEKIENAIFCLGSKIDQNSFLKIIHSLEKCHSE